MNTNLMGGLLTQTTPALVRAVGLFYCAECETTSGFSVGFEEWDTLKQHMADVHQTDGVCSLCHHAGRVFVSELDGDVTTYWCVDEADCFERVLRAAEGTPCP